MSNALAFLGRDMAVDLGTANTLVYVRGRGIVLNEPSVVALNTNNGQIVAVGVEAKRMIGRTPGNIVAVRPLKDGVIADFDVTERMLRYFIQKVHKRSHLAKPRVVVAVPRQASPCRRHTVLPPIAMSDFVTAVGLQIRHRSVARNHDEALAFNGPRASVRT